MQPADFSGLHYLVSSLPSPYPPPQVSSVQQVGVVAFQQNQCTFHTPAQMPQSSYLSNNSTSDEADEQQINLINERKQRRMISNRESARRSRMRKQRHLDELWSQVVWLRNENNQLVEKLNHVSECYDQALQENAQLKEEASDLRQAISDMKLKSAFSSLRDLDDIPCDNAYP